MPQNYFFNNCESLVDLKDICPPLSVVMPVQCAWKTLEKAAAVAMNGQESYHLSETDFPFLDLKPEVDEFKVNKGRRNANEQLMKKKLAGQAFVLKQVVGQNGQCKVIGKKRRARLLSENNEDMKLNVPYSLNRKGRWELESAADCLKEQQSDENVQLSALDQHLTAKGLSPSKEILAFHQVNEDGAMSSRKAQSKCGATLSELNATASDEKPLNIRYVMAKAHPHNKGLIAGSLDKAKPLPRSTKRAQLDISVYSTDGGETTEDETHLISPQAEETIEMYKPKNYTTYSLADFVHDKKDSALVRTRSRRVPLDSYVQVEMPEVQEGSESTSLPTSPLNKIGQSMSLMKTLHVPSQLLGVTCRDNWLQQCTQLAERPELRFQFLNAAQCSFQIDVTPILTTSKTPHLVLTLANDVKNERVRLIFNRSQECQINWRTLDAAFAQQMNGFDELLQTVVKNSKITLKEQSALPKHLSSEFNSTQLSAQVSPLDNYSLLYGAKPAVVAKSAPIEENDEEDGEFNDFEYIAMDQFVDSDQVLETKWRDAILDEQVAQMKTLCDECGENDTTKILLLDQCGHSYCFRCLKASLYQQICENVPLLSCSSNGCSNEIPSILLQSIFELPVVAMTLQSCAESKAKKLDQQVFVCPTGCGIAILDPSSNKLGQVQCDTCKNHFCFNCHKEPHWPLSCAQNETWSRKRELQSRNESDDATKNEISQQYWTVCNDARKRRTDLQATRKVAKDVLKKVGYKLERQFSELRKACLQVVENGYAFLYVTTRNNRPSNWSTIKAQLASLYREFNSLENAFVYGSQNVDKLAENMQKMRNHLRKAVAEIRPQ